MYKNNHLYMKDYHNNRILPSIWFVSFIIRAERRIDRTDIFGPCLRSLNKNHQQFHVMKSLTFIDI